MTKVTCVDISEFQQNIDFNKMKNDGIKAVIIRAGYGREVSQKDSMFESHFRNAKNANLKIGVYWYSYADSVNDAEKEAKACLECIKNKSLDMPIYYDLEDSSQLHLGKTKITEIAERFCETVKENGYRAGVYANLNWFNNYLDYKRLKSKYSIWLAQYNDKAELDCDIWQNSSTGRVSGYSGNIDTNVIYNDNIFGKSESKVAKPTLTYRVFADGKWYSEVKGLSNVAGRKKQAISAIALKVSKGKTRYRVHLLNGDWLPWVNGYDISDSDNGYAGIKGKVIDAVQVEFEGVGNYKATYRVRKQGKSSFFDWQYNSEQDSSQDGYAGLFGNKIDGLQITLT
ncbi:glycoside hydrolase family 25 protein [Ruminococcus sp. FMB-CY1]|uniref:glycoside hydrolase family 25 protein n=1 Tax=unclassified Ruminococcus TaxID=2608920 RepID=UPI00208FC7F5|nr:MULTISPECIES: glycoside hydrolase family 25 protein [unclassified Ruminococcus]USP70394.1 glycoside hydrolase family 25 protein [Ruminococcus sp. FMBCY1]WBX58439.1 glycoside hydrolase family 25 protein [Ruminococcus sp. FMB-CY1]